MFKDHTLRRSDEHGKANVGVVTGADVAGNDFNARLLDDDKMATGKSGEGQTNWNEEALAPSTTISELYQCADQASEPR